jgi:hypothetical protein
MSSTTVCRDALAVAAIEMIKAQALLAYPAANRTELIQAAAAHMRASNAAWRRSLHWSRLLM